MARERDFDAEGNLRPHALRAVMQEARRRPGLGAGPAPQRRGADEAVQLLREVADGVVRGVEQLARAVPRAWLEGAPHPAPARGQANRPALTLPAAVRRQWRRPPWRGLLFGAGMLLVGLLLGRGTLDRHRAPHGGPEVAQPAPAAPAAPSAAHRTQSKPESASPASRSVRRSSGPTRRPQAQPPRVKVAVPEQVRPSTDIAQQGDLQQPSGPSRAAPRHPRASGEFAPLRSQAWREGCLRPSWRGRDARWRTQSDDAEFVLREHVPYEPNPYPPPTYPSTSVPYTPWPQPRVYVYPYGSPRPWIAPPYAPTCPPMLPYGRVPYMPPPYGYPVPAPCGPRFLGGR